jgi:hypothetical protein
MGRVIFSDSEVGFSDTNENYGQKWRKSWNKFQPVFIFNQFQPSKIWSKSILQNIDQLPYNSHCLTRNKFMCWNQFMWRRIHFAEERNDSLRSLCKQQHVKTHSENTALLFTAKERRRCFSLQLLLHYNTAVWSYGAREIKSEAKRVLRDF